MYPVLTQVSTQGKPISPDALFSYNTSMTWILVTWFDHILDSIRCLAIMIQWDLHLRLPQVIFIWS